MCLCHEVATWGIVYLIEKEGYEALLCHVKQGAWLLNSPLTPGDCLTYRCHLQLSFLQHLPNLPQSFIAFPQDSQWVEANLQNQHFE